MLFLVAKGARALMFMGKADVGREITVADMAAVILYVTGKDGDFSAYIDHLEEHRFLTPQFCFCGIGASSQILGASHSSAAKR